MSANTTCNIRCISTHPDIDILASWQYFQITMDDPLKVHKALADETRLRLVRLLSQGPLNVNEIIDILHMGQSRIARHLKILAEAELVTNRREGTWVYYHANTQPTGNLRSEMLDLLRRHEHDLPFHKEDLQGLEGVVERRHAQTRDFSTGSMIPSNCIRDCR